MKVIFVTSESFLDHSFTMAKDLKKKTDLKVIIAAKTLTAELSFFCEELDANFFKRERFINPFAIIKEIQLLMFIRKQKADLVWFNTFSFAQAIIAKFFIKKFIINIHDVENHPGEKDYHGIISKKATVFFYKKRIAVMSESQQKIFEKKYHVNPVLFRLPEIDFYESSAKNKTKALRVLNENDIVRFFFFGSVLMYKGFETLLDAAEITEKKGLRFELNIYGKLKYNVSEFENRIKKIGSITLKNEFVDYTDVFEVYKNNDIIIIPYRQVTQCGPMLIGYNQNVPLICSDLPGFREYVVDGKSGLIFNNTPQGLAEKMKEIIKAPQKINDMRDFIKTEIKDKFSMQILSKDYISVFEKNLN